MTDDREPRQKTVGPAGQDYEVGYGKPPEHSRFKPGNAGRPKGSGKRELSIGDILAEAMSKRRKVRRGDRVVKMAVAEIYVERLIAMATTGSANDMLKVLALIARHAPNLLSAPEIEARVTYYRAPGSTVQLPSVDLWKGSKDV